MILKNGSIKFNLNFLKTDSNIGLREGDLWCRIQILLEGSDFQYKFSENALSKSELDDFIQELVEFSSSKKVFSRRMTFIKNYLIVYFQSLKSGRKVLKIKFINVDNNHNNIVVKFEDDEIKELSSELMKYN